MKRTSTLLLGFPAVVASTVLVLVLVASAVPANALPALAAEPLPAPTRLAAIHVADTSADLSWLSSGAFGQDVVERRVNGSWREFSRPDTSFLAVTGLAPATTYTFRVYTIPLPDQGYSTSPRSAPVSFTTLSGPDTQLPAKPAAPTFSSITTTSANAFWPETTDNVEVTVYHLQQLVGVSWSTIRTVSASERFQFVNGLSAGGSYSFAVIAFDAKGNLSPRSDVGVLTTLANTSAMACSLQLITFAPGFIANITVTNSTPAPVSGWNVQFTAPASTTVTSSFGGSVNGSSPTLTFTPAVYYATLASGSRATVGFVGSSAGAVFSPPSGFTLAGVPCTIA